TAVHALQSGVDYLGVAFLDEAIELRRAGIQAPILVLGYTPPTGYEIARDLDISITAYDDHMIEALQDIEMTDSKRKLKLHIKIDSGMGRIGVPADERGIAFIDRVRALPGIEVEGLYTHYACADEQDKSYTYMQHEKFSRIISHYREQGIEFPYIH